MGKIVTVPTGSKYVPISSNQTIGTISNWNATTKTFEVSDITITNIKNVLGEDTNVLSELCTSSLVNHNALFSPSGGAPYRMGDFAGYNKYALPAVFIKDCPNNQQGMIVSGSASLYFKIEKGEKPPSNLPAYVKLQLTTSEGTFYSPVHEVSDDPSYDYSSMSGFWKIEVPGSTPRTLTSCALTGLYCNGPGTTVYGSIEGGTIYPITIVLNMTYIDIDPATINQTFDSIRHFYYGDNRYTYLTTVATIDSMYSYPPSFGTLTATLPATVTITGYTYTKGISQGKSGSFYPLMTFDYISTTHFQYKGIWYNKPSISGYFHTVSTDWNNVGNWIVPGGTYVAY